MTWKRSHSIIDTWHWFHGTAPIAACGVPFAPSSLIEPNAYVLATDNTKCEACKERLGIRKAL